jgi:hypothetical protein
MRDKLSRAEIRKDALQDGVTAATHTVGAIATIVTSAVGDVAKALGGFATEIFEIRDSARRASQDHRETDPEAGADEGVDDGVVAVADDADVPPDGPVDEDAGPDPTG